MAHQLQAEIEGFEPRPCPFCAKLFLHYEIFDDPEYVAEDFVGFRVACDACQTKGPFVKVVLSICVWQPGTQDFIDHGTLMALEAWNERQLTDTIGQQFGNYSGQATAV